MQTALRRRTTWAIAASVLAHLGVLGAVVLQRHNLPLPQDESAGPPIPIIPLLLMPRAPPVAVSGGQPPGAVRLHRRQQRTDDSVPASVAPLVTPPTSAPTRPSDTQSVTAAAQTLAPSAGPPAPDLRAALSHGAAGCASLSALGMSRADREHCEDQLARGVSSAPFMPAALEPRIRTYYDAVALAKQRDPPHVAVINKAPIPGDPSPQRPGGDHLPYFYCSLHFGEGPQPKRRPNALYLGDHCVVGLPKGPLDPEVDITPP